LTLNTLNDPRTEKWLLPDGVNELMPEDAWRVESLRRLIMDSSYRWGYELVMPPLIEYLDSLLTGTGETLDLQTIKFIDQHNGRSLGIRADMTPQVARIDAHTLRSELPNRLFYTGSVLRARTDGAGGSRTPLQFGAELFGHAGPESDAEIIQLMLDTIVLAGVPLPDVLLDVGHVGVFRALMAHASLSQDLEEHVFQALLRGSGPEVNDLLTSAQTKPETRRQFRDLAALSGESSAVLPEARERLADAGPAVIAALDNLQAVIDTVQQTHPQLNVHVDLAELRGYRYHTGMLFALYDAQGSELARGGRYDAIGESFGRARPATGFSGDLIKLALAYGPAEQGMFPAVQGIWVDLETSNLLTAEIQRLRKSGERVVVALQGSAMDATHCHCDRILRSCNDQWIVEKLT